MYKQISSNFFNNRITYKLSSYKSYVYIDLTVYKQMIDIELTFMCPNTILEIISLYANKLLILNSNIRVW